MATYEKQFLSAGSGGPGIFLGSSGLPVTVHTTGTSSTIIDEVWLYVANNGINVSSVTVTIDGGNMYVNIPVESGMILVVPGLPLSGTGSGGRVISCTDNLSSGEVYVYGYVNRITP